MNARKPAPQERMTLTKLGTLMEAVQKEVRLVAENHLSLRSEINRLSTSSGLLHVLHSEFETFKGALLEVAGDVKILKGDVAQLKMDVNTLKADVATLKTDVRDIKDRLSLVEAK